MTTWEPEFNPNPVQSRFVLDVLMGQVFSMYFAFDTLIDTQNKQHCKNLELHMVKKWLGRP